MDLKRYAVSWRLDSNNLRVRLLVVPNRISDERRTMLTIVMLCIVLAQTPLCAV